MQKRAKQEAKDASTASKRKIFPKPFGIDRQRIRIKANAEETLKGAFLPFTLGQHTCSIVFEDASCGKFVYEVTGETSLPQPFNKFRFQVSYRILAFSVSQSLQPFSARSRVCGSLLGGVSISLRSCTSLTLPLVMSTMGLHHVPDVLILQLHWFIGGHGQYDDCEKSGMQVSADGPQTRDISLPWNNSQIDAARRTFLDRHPLAKNKEQVALAKGEGVLGAVQYMRCSFKQTCEGP